MQENANSKVIVLMFERYLVIYARAQRGGQRGHNSPGAEKSQQCRKYFFNTVHLLPKDLRFEHGGAKLASCPGPHLTSLHSWLY